MYRVSLVVNGGVKACIMNTSTKADQATQLNFDLKQRRHREQPHARQKESTWSGLPPTTGSHTGGRWVEVDDGGSAGAGALNVKRGSAEALRQQQLQNPPGGLPPNSTGATAVGPSARSFGKANPCSQKHYNEISSKVIPGSSADVSCIINRRRSRKTN